MRAFLEQVRGLIHGHGRNGASPSRVTGYVDGFLGGSLEGWAVTPDMQLPASVRVFIDGQDCGTARCDGYREDLSAASLRDGYAQFRFKIPLRLQDGYPHRASVVNLATGEELLPGAIEFTLRARRRHKPYLVRPIEFRGGHDDFVSALSARRRVALVATYGNHRRFLASQKALIGDLVALGYVVVLAHAEGEVAITETVNDVDGLACLIVRSNQGYDFGSWAAGMSVVREHSDLLDELLLINDSNFGSVRKINKRLKKQKSPFTCMTDSYEVSHHAQSYFLSFGQEILREGPVFDFFDEYQYEESKENVIKNCEIGMSREIVRCGFPIRPLYPYEQVAERWLEKLPQTIDDIISAYETIGISGGVHVQERLEKLSHIAEMIVNNVPANPSHFFWRTLVKYFDYPFIKRELIMVNPAEIPDLILAFLGDDLRKIVDLKHIREYADIEGGGPAVLLQAAGAVAAGSSSNGNGHAKAMQAYEETRFPYLSETVARDRDGGF